MFSPSYLVSMKINVSVRNNIPTQIMTAYALQRRLNDVGITVSTVHPGSVSTHNCCATFSTQWCYTANLLFQVNTNIDRGVHDNQLFKFVAFCVMKGTFPVMNYIYFWPQIYNFDFINTH